MENADKNYAKAPELLGRRIEAYFSECDIVNSGSQKDIVKPYTLSGLCLSLGIDRQTLDKLAAKPRTRAFVKRARLKIEASIEENALRGRLAATPALYSLKYNFGWSDKLADRQEKESKTVKLTLGGECEKWAD